MSRLISVIAISMLLNLSCARYQNTQIPISAIDNVPIKYRIGKLESKHSKELEEFIRNNYEVLLTENEDAPIINANFIHMNTRKPSNLRNIVTVFSIGFIGRDFSVDVRCILQIIKNKQIISESIAEGTGKVES